MPGGNKNIKPEDGKQFSKDYQPAEKWTEEKALKVGNELLKWLKSEEEHIFFDEFLYIEEDYYPMLVTYLKNKFTAFSYLLQRAKKIQETKLMKYGVMDKLNASMTKFALINNHNWADKSEVKTTNINKEVPLTTEELNEFNSLLNEKY